MSDYTSVTQVSAKPELNQALSRDERKSLGVGSYYVDTYNDAQLAKYNNEYNYWLWQQQAEYNSPASQMQRAREAGLNPNIIASNVSSGNLSGTPQSNASYRSHTFQDSTSAIQTGLNIFNSLLSSISQGVESVSKLSGIPDDISSYRSLINQTQIQGWQKNYTDLILKNLEQIRRSYDLGLTENFTLLDSGPLNHVSQEPYDYWQAVEGSPYARQFELRNSLMVLKNLSSEYDLQNIKPAELDRIKAQIQKIDQDASFVETRNGMYKLEFGAGFISKLLSVFF